MSDLAVFLVNDLAALRKARRTGTLTVLLSTGQQTYGSVAEIDDAIAELQIDIRTLDLDTLRRARRNGAKRVRLPDREVEYKSDAEMAAAIGALEAELRGPIEPRNIVVRTSKGW